MPRHPADRTALVTALREARRALEAGAEVEGVRSALRPHMDALRAASTGDVDHVRALLRENDRLAARVTRLEREVRALEDALGRGAGPPG